MSTQVKRNNRIWLAGFIDGEGGINVTRCRTTFFVRILITHTDKDVLELIRSWYGGNIHSKKHKINWKTSHFYRVSNNKAMLLLEDVYPYLKLKKTQADIAFWMMGHKRRRR